VKPKFTYLKFIGVNVAGQGFQAKHSVPENTISQKKALLTQRSVRLFLSDSFY
jgi:hypothetical protein